MRLNLMKQVRDNDIRFIVFDIDGTIKDLYKEHKAALIEAFKKLNIEKTIRAKLALWLNSFGMSFFKLGCLPTNSLMQNILIWIMSIVTFKNYKELKRSYYLSYPEKSILFEDMKCQILSLPFEMDIILASTNDYTLSTKHELCNMFCVKELKEKTYKTIIQNINVPPSNILVVGDNFFDDYLPAKRLGCKTCMVNMYNSKLKDIIITLTWENPSSN